MADKYLAAFSKERNFTYDTQRGVAYGNYSGFSTTITRHGEEYLITLTVGGSDEERERTVTDFLRSLVDKHPHVIMGNYQARCVLVGMKPQKDGTSAALSSLLSEITTCLNSNYFKNTCKHCGEPRPLSACSVHGKVEYMCDSCFTSTAGNAADVKKPRGNVLTGIIGAVIFSLAGVALWMVIDQLGYIAGIAGIAMMFLAMKGYEVFGGKLTRGSVILCFIISLGMIFVSVNAAIILDFYLQLVRPMGYGILDMEISYVLELAWSDSDIVASMMYSLIMGLILYLVCGIAYVRQAFKNAGGKTEVIRLS